MTLQLIASPASDGPSGTVPPVAPARPHWRRLVRRASLFLLGLALVAAAGLVVFQRSHAAGENRLRTTANGRLDLFASVVESRVRRLEPVPATIQLHPAVQTLLRAPDPGPRLAASDYLGRLNAHLGSAAVYVLDVRGIVLASSNMTETDDSLVGEDVSYRPYYLDALAGRTSRHFAMGSGGRAGYFASHPIYDGSRVLGVAVVKIGLDALGQTWPMLEASALVMDANQVVILSSQPDWRYTSMVPLSPERRVDLQLTRAYGSLRLPHFPIDVALSVNEDTQRVQGFVSGQEEQHRRVLGAGADRSGHLVLGRSLDGMDWRVLSFTSLEAVRRQALVDAAGGAASASFLILLTLYWGQRRRVERQKLAAKRLLEQANANLERQVALRTQELTDANGQLRREIAERKQTESELRAAQHELVHAGKMAVLGQLSASITHELTQPLGGIRTLAGNGVEYMRRGNHSAALDNLLIVARLVDQMGRIIDPLKSFARKSSASPAAVDLGRVVEQALFLYQQRVRHDQVQVENRCVPGLWTAWCDANRLEQVLVNLVGNALDAMRESDPRVLTVSAEGREAAGRPVVVLTVRDSGKGLSEVDQQRLFEPFFTTKPSGAGLGLGLAICRDLAAEFGGDLHAHNHPEGGACFVLTVPVGPAVDTANDAAAR